MVKRVFQIACNSEQLLTADAIAEALLRQFTLNSPKLDNFFAVIECPEKGCQRPKRRR